jgi:hypothetical protein
MPTAQRIAFLRGHTDAVVCLSVTHDSQLLASGAEVSLVGPNCGKGLGGTLPGWWVGKGGVCWNVNQRMGMYDVC